MTCPARKARQVAFLCCGSKSCMARTYSGLESSADLEEESVGSTAVLSELAVVAGVTSWRDDVEELWAEEGVGEMRDMLESLLAGAER